MKTDGSEYRFVELNTNPSNHNIDTTHDGMMAFRCRLPDEETRRPDGTAICVVNVNGELIHQIDDPKLWRGDPVFNR